MQPLYEYVCHLKGHRNSKGELAEWVIKSHETGEILSSHKSEKKAKEHLQQMHIFKESVDSMSYKLLGESTNGNTMDKQVAIFMESVGQLGLSKNQVDAIGKITNVCLESTWDGSTDEGLADSEPLVYTPENDAEFFKEAFKRAAIEVQNKFPNRLYEDEVPEKGLVLVDKKSGKRFSLILRKGPADPIHFDPNCHGIEVRIGSDRKEYPLWLRKSKSIDELIDLMFDCIAQEVRYSSDDDELSYNHTGRGKKVRLEGSFGQTQEPDDDDIGFVYVSREGHSALSNYSKMSYADFLKERDKLASHGDVGPIKKYRMPLIDTEETQVQYVNYDSIPEDTNGNAWGFEYGRKSGFEYISEKYIWLPSDAFDNSVPLEKEGTDVGCIGEMSSNARENILGIRRDKTYDDFLNGYNKARDLATREPDEFKVSKLQRYSTPEFNPLSVKPHHMSFDSIKPDENGNVLGYEEYHRPGHPFQVVTKILWLPANTDEPTDETPSDYDIASELYPDEAPTYGGRVCTSEDDYDPDNPNDTDDDMFYDGNGRVNELDPDEELEF